MNKYIKYGIVAAASSAAAYLVYKLIKDGTIKEVFVNVQDGLGLAPPPPENFIAAPVQQTDVNVLKRLVEYAQGVIGNSTSEEKEYYFPDPNFVSLGNPDSVATGVNDWTNFWKTEAGKSQQALNDQNEIIWKDVRIGMTASQSQILGALWFYAKDRSSDPGAIINALKWGFLNPGQNVNRDPYIRRPKVKKKGGYGDNNLYMAVGFNFPAKAVPT